MAMPQPVVGITWVLSVLLCAVSIWAYSGLIMGVAFMGGAILMGVFFLVKEKAFLASDGKNHVRGTVILIMTIMAVGVWVIAAPGLGIFFGATAIFGYLVGLICSEYAEDHGNNHK